MKRVLSVLMIGFSVLSAYPQEFDIVLQDRSLILTYGELSKTLPLFSAEINDHFLLFDESLKSDLGLEISRNIIKHPKGGYQVTVEFTYTGEDTLKIANIVPFGQHPDRIYITGQGPPALARAKLFRPTYGPIDITLPDNAWELGYCSFKLTKDVSVCALARRRDSDKA
jgi:hypothetical protein